MDFGMAFALLADSVQMGALDYVLAVVALLAGLGAFLFGFKVLSDNIEKLATNKLRRWFDKTGKSRLAGVGIGAGVTAIIQSSSGDDRSGRRIRKRRADVAVSGDYRHHGREHRHHRHRLFFRHCGPFRSSKSSLFSPAWAYLWICSAKRTSPRPSA